MKLPDIDFASIRPHDGSRHTGFEEMCAQLASLEDQPAGAIFTRKGRGGDAGLECFYKLPEGDELGWQAKYVFGWDASLSSQLDKSIEAAISKHPRLTRFVVCLPFDLSDSRPKNGQSARQKWESWRQKWEQAAQKQGRKLNISLWGRSELCVKLSIDKPAYSGRLLYWFSREMLTASWFTEQFGKAKEALGSRYTPDTNIELQIRKDFLAFARDPSIESIVQDWANDIADIGASAKRAVVKANQGESTAQTNALTAAIEKLSAVLKSEIVGPEAEYPLEKWKSALLDCETLTSSTLAWVYSLPEIETKHGTSDQAWARENLFRLTDRIGHINEALSSDQWQLINAHAVLLKGDAGTGKSHLLADVVEHQIHANRPAVLVLGSAMVEGEPWREIMAQLDLPGDLRAQQFLGMLDAAAQAADVRAIVCIDAINERHGTDIWPDRLAAFLAAAKSFPRVGIVLSCRSTYVAYIIPDSLDNTQLTTITHRGFGGRGGEAANLYLLKRGIARPGAPKLVPEFLNPLFLKTCCDFLDREGKNELPRGLRGVSAIFGFYREAVARAVTRRMKLDHNLELVETALTRFADLLVERGEGYASKTEVVAVFDGVLPSDGRLDRSLLAQLESEGVIALEPVRKADGSIVRMVRHTFERYSDHAIAARLLEEHLNPDDPTGSFAAGTPLGQFTFGAKNYRNAGVIEAIAIQLPEKVGTEIIDLSPEDDWTVRNAFNESLLWREQTYFTDRTLELVQQLNSTNRVLDVLVSIATEPSNKFNADYLHKRLKLQSMPDRDALWSVYVNGRGEDDDAVSVLIVWAMQNGMGAIEDERARLTAVALSWLLSSSNRIVRDRATKALACLFANRITLAASTLRTFHDLDDLYVRERLFAAVYGAALQGKETDGLSELASTVYELVFASGSPPLNELLRDHARGIVTYINWRGHLPTSIDYKSTQPPYKSSWPIEYVPDAFIDSYKQNHSETFFCDAIVSSAVNDGDFARYVVDHMISKWAPVPLSSAECPSVANLAMAWYEEFTKSAKSAQLVAYEALVAASHAASGQTSYENTPERAALKTAESAFQDSLSNEEWEKYRVTAKNYTEHGMFSEWWRDQPARFDGGWARRWICKRAHELGWTPERFAGFERNASVDRHDHRVERIGKKYQWLALGELISRMADNLLFMGNDGPRPYSGAREVGLRDIDPTLLITKTMHDGWRQWPRSWWVPAEPRLREIPPLERLAWLDSENDILNDASLIDLTDPKTSRRWLPLHGFASWSQFGIDGDSKEMQRDTWYRVTCIVVAKEQEAKVAKGLKDKLLTDSHAIPQFHLDGEFYLGEFPWHPDLRVDDGWTHPDQWNEFKASVLATTSEYHCGRGGHDYSIDDTVRIALPAPWLAEAMKVRLLDGQRPTFVDASGITRFFDPSVTEPGYDAALVCREAFLNVLTDKGLAPIWVVAGEKGVFGGRDSHQGYGGRVTHTAIYRLNSDGFSRTFHKLRDYPDEKQLAGLLGEQPSAELVARFARPHIVPHHPNISLREMNDVYKVLIQE
jgi:hypothetical protein